MVLLFNQQHLYLYVITSQQYECQWKSDLKCWVSNCSSVCKKTSESAQSLTAGFGQRNASIWLSLKGRSQKQIYKKTWKCNKMQSSKNLDLLQVLIYAVVQLSSMFFSNADKGGNNSWFQQCIWKYPFQQEPVHAAFWNSSTDHKSAQYKKPIATFSSILPCWTWSIKTKATPPPKNKTKTNFWTKEQVLS